ncbi:spore germination protein [Paenibacillus pseudetheri]|nr:spore germination protein [Paenibacillus pseudetheri]
MIEAFQLIKKQLATSCDLKKELVRIQDIELEILYLVSVCDEKKIKADLIYSILECSSKEEFKDYLTSLPDISNPEKEQDILQKLMVGHACIQMENEIFLFSAKKVINNQLGDASSETAIYGSQRSFSDVIDTNLNLIRYRYPSPNLVYEQRKLRGLPQTEVGLVYDSLLVDKGLLIELQTQLNSIKSDVILSAAHLQRLLTSRKYSLFPTLMITERPDRVALNLIQGKVVLLVEGSPFVLIAPATFYDFISSMDDTFEQLWVGFSLVVLRYIGIFITVLLPGIYISLVSFNPELFQAQLAFSIAGSRAGIPYPSYIEVLIMMFLIDTLIEASIRLPKSISAAATTVGGLILGQAAQQANLVSNIMIIVTSAIGIANFVVPINAMSFALRIVKYPFILLASLFGYVGLIVGLFCLILYLNDLKSFGKPYLKVFIGEQEKFGKL